MHVLLLWDFSSGTAVAAQVRSGFNSPINFSSSLATKEFFLVISLSFSSFDLSE
jgi:hypothetical protein